jgi:hypothetical protein
MCCLVKLALLRQVDSLGHELAHVVLGGPYASMFTVL